MLGWVCGFKPGRGWNGCMSLPRVLTLDQDQRLVQTPAVELKKLRGRHIQVENLSLSSQSRRIEGAQGDTLEIVAAFKAGDASAFGLKVRCSEDGRDAETLRSADGTLNVCGTELIVDGGIPNGLWQRVRLYKESNSIFQFGNQLDYARGEGRLCGFREVVVLHGGRYLRRSFRTRTRESPRGLEWDGKR